MDACCSCLQFTFERSIKAHNVAIKALQKMQQNFIDCQAKTEVVIAIGDEIKKMESNNQELIGAMKNLVKKSDGAGSLFTGTT